MRPPIVLKCENCKDNWKQTFDPEPNYLQINYYKFGEKILNYP